MNDVLIAKCEQMLNGQEVIMSDAELDELIPYNIADYVASKFNPNQIGTKDRYVAFIKNPAKAKNDKPFELA